MSGCGVSGEGRSDIESILRAFVRKPLPPTRVPRSLTAADRKSDEGEGPSCAPLKPSRHPTQHGRHPAFCRVALLRDIQSEDGRWFITPECTSVEVIEGPINS